MDAVIAASRALVAVAARSLAPIEEAVTLTEWRVLMVVSGEQRTALNDVANALGVHPSTATRLCDRLVAGGLLLRQEDPDDRRYLCLGLTRKGRRVVDRVIAARRREVEAILDRVSDPARMRIVTALQEFAAAAGETTHDQLWDLAALG